jgi:hypothetical protein
MGVYPPQAPNTTGGWDRATWRRFGPPRGVVFFFFKIKNKKNVFQKKNDFQKNRFKKKIPNLNINLFFIFLKLFRNLFNTFLKK